MSTPNIITAVIGQMHRLATRPIYQTDSGIRLFIAGKGLPETLQVDFANVTSGENAQTYTVTTAEGVEVPVNLIRQGKDIHAYAVWTNADYSVTRYDICIPVIQRAINTDDMTPKQRSYIDEAVETCQGAAAQCAADVAHYPRVEDGMWTVYNAVTGEWVSTGVPATGPQGIQGPKGDTGDTGPQGPKGDTGITGVAAVALPAGSEPTATYEGGVVTFGIPPGVHTKLYAFEPNHTYTPPSGITGWNMVETMIDIDDIAITENGEYGGDGTYFEHISVDVPGCDIREDVVEYTDVALNDLNDYVTDEGLPQFLWLYANDFIKRLESGEAGDTGYLINYSDLLRGMADNEMVFRVIYAQDHQGEEGYIEKYMNFSDDLNAQADLLNYCQMKGWLET